jgi:hypothetical protein
MNFPWVTILLMVFLFSCGDDLAGKQRGQKASPERTTQAIEGENVLINSQVHRIRGFNILSSSDEIELILNNKLPNAYRIIPDMALDDEGSNAKNIMTTSGIGRPGIECGMGESFKGIDNRISDCHSKNKDKSIWSGKLYGASGESTWKLVALTPSGKEIWQDLRTNLVWSDVIATANWCKASGNKQPPSLNNSIDCSSLSEDQSFCVGANIEGFGNNIKWRLPTRNDYLQADINGLRFVLKSGSATGSWTATLEAASGAREKAWIYHLTNGTLESAEMTTERLVRCVGAPVN